MNKIVAINFERESLHKEVWTLPMTKLAAKYGLSDNGLRRVCKALAIPIPERGYWAKVASGQTPTPRKLPVHKGPTEFVSHFTPPAAPSPEANKDNEWLQERLRFEADPANKISVPSELGQPHTLVAATQRALKTMHAKLEKSRLLAERPKKQNHHANWKPSLILEPPFWSEFVNNGQMVFLSGDVLPMSVSFNSTDRALRIWDTILRAYAVRGFKRVVKADRLSLNLYGVTVDLRMTERIERIENSTKNMSPLDVLLNKHISKNPTGELRIFASAAASDWKLSETPHKPLEAQLNALFCKIYKIIVARKADERRWKEEEIQREIDAQRRDEERQLRLNKEQHEAEERKRAQNLIAEVNAWDQADRIRAYLVHITTLAKIRDIPCDENSPLGVWLLWASNVANGMDPSTERLSSILCNRVFV